MIEALDMAAVLAYIDQALRRRHFHLDETDPIITFHLRFVCNLCWTDSGFITADSDCLALLFTFDTLGLADDRLKHAANC